VDLTAAQKRIAVLEEAAARFKMPLNRKARMEHQALQGNRRGREALDALFIAMSQDPVNLDLLKLALAEAKLAGCRGVELERATSMLSQQENTCGVLLQLRKGIALHNVGSIRDSLTQLTRLGVAAQEQLSAMNSLYEEQSRLLRRAGEHGISTTVLSAIEQERRDLHNQIISAAGGIQVVCRIRPATRHEGSDAAIVVGDPQTVYVSPAKSHGASLLSFSFITRPTPFRFKRVLGPQCDQREVYEECRGLLQSAIDGYNVAIIGCGSVGGGKTFSMLGPIMSVGLAPEEQDEFHGIVPRLVKELFHLRERDSWCASLDIDVQVLEVYDAASLSDVLGMGGGGGEALSLPLSAVRRNTPQRQVWVGNDPQDAGSEAAMLTSFGVTIQGACTRRITTADELHSIIEDCWQRRADMGTSHHVLLNLYLTRTVKITGVVKKSRLVLSELLGYGAQKSQKSEDAYAAMEKVFKAVSTDCVSPDTFQEHVLTQLLEDCVGKPAKTLLVVAVGPSSEERDASYAAVSFAASGQW